MLSNVNGCTYICSDRTLAEEIEFPWECMASLNKIWDFFKNSNAPRKLVVVVKWEI